MAFPSNPSNGDTYLRYGRTYEYDSAMSMWKVKKSSIAIDDLDDVDLTTVAPQSGDYLQYDGTNFVPYNTAKLVSYTTIAALPLSGVASGQMAYVQENGRLYIFNGAGWFSIALVNVAPTITTGPDASYIFATDGTPIILTLEAQDPEEIPISWSYQVSSGAIGSTATIVQNDNVFTITPSTNEADIGTFSITFIASDGINLATAVSSFTLVFAAADQYFNYNTLLVKTSSTNSLANNTFINSVDQTTGTQSSALANWQGSINPYSPYGWSTLFDGSGDKLQTTAETSLALQSNDFTVELWYNPNGRAQSYPSLVNNGAFGSNKWGINDRHNAANTKIMVNVYNASTSDGWLLSTTSVKEGNWYHVAFVRSGNNFTLYVNGVAEDTKTFAGSVSAASDTIYVGMDSSQAATAYTGYISNLRIVNGTAVYTSNFTPPTEPLTAISNTVLLTCQDNRFIDNSSNSIAITGVAQATASPNSPFRPTTEYDYVNSVGTMTTKGASGDWLSFPVTTFKRGVDSWTIEGWYFTPTISSQALFGDASFYLQWSTTTIYVGDGTTNPINTALNSAIKPLQWNHLAVSFDGTSLRLFINGVLHATGNALTSGNVSQIWIGWKNASYYARVNDMISDFRLVTGTALYTTSNFTPPTEPLTAISGTQLLMRANNAGVYDAMGKNIISLSNNASPSTTQTKYNSSSFYFDGTGDFAEIPITKDLYAETASDFTAECWVYINALKDSVFVGQNNSTVFSWGIRMTSTGLFYFGLNGADHSSGVTASTGQWYHLALVYDSVADKKYGFVNGVKYVDVALTAISPNTTIPLNIGGRTATLWNADAYIEDIRITKGIARYTADFTPPTAALGFNNPE